MATVELGVVVSKTTDVSVTVFISVVTSVAVAKLRCIVNFERRVVRLYGGKGRGDERTKWV